MYRVIRASEDYEEDDLFDPFDGRIYMIFGSDSHGNLLNEFTNDPVVAIEQWFKISKKFPTNTYIQCRKRSDAIKLCEAAEPDYIQKLYNKYKNPYKLDYLIDAVKKQVDNKCKYFYENEYGDMIHPFDLG